MIISPAAWSRRATDASLTLWYGAAVVFLFAPIFAALGYSFNTGMLNKQTATFTGWTVNWYAAAWHDLTLRRATTTSVEVALWATMIAVLLGGSLGYAIVRHPDPALRRGLAALTYILLIVPESVNGVSLLLFFAVTHTSLATGTLVAGITPASIAVVALIVRARLLTLDRRVEEAAADLGSTPLKTLWFIVLPPMAPAIAAAAVMAYTFSFDNLVVSAFLTTPRVNTLPVYLYGSLQYGAAPTVYAAASLVFVFTVAMLGLAIMLYQLAQRTGRRPTSD